MFSDQHDRGLDILGDGPIKARGEKLNEKGAQALAGQVSKKASQAANGHWRKGRGRLLLSGPRKDTSRGVATVAGGNSRAYRQTHEPQKGSSDASFGTEGQH